jgi:WD40 repeat protein
MQIKYFSKPFYASGGNDRIIHIWNSLTKKKIFSSRVYENPISNMVFSENGKSLIFTCNYLFDDKFSLVPKGVFFSNGENEDLNFSFNNHAIEKGNKEDENDNDEINQKLKKCEILLDVIDDSPNAIVNRLYILNLK